METIDETIYKVKLLAGEHPQRDPSYLKELYMNIIIRLEECKDLKGAKK